MYLVSKSILLLIEKVYRNLYSIVKKEEIKIKRKQFLFIKIMLVKLENITIDKYNIVKRSK